MIVLDIETSGLEPGRHSILSIGAVEFENPSNQFYGECRVRDGAEISEEALKVNGFSREEITKKDKRGLDSLLKEFGGWIEKVADRTPGGHNIGRFDLTFIDHSSKLYGIKISLGHRVGGDVHGLVYSSHLTRGIAVPLKFNRSDINSDFSLRYVGLPEEPRPHNALTGAKMEAEALSRLILGKCLFEEYSKFPVPQYLVR